MLLTLLSLLLLSVSLSSSTLIVDYTAPSPASNLGKVQLQGNSASNSAIKATGGDDLFIQPGQDPHGKQALHYHKDATDRRAETKLNGDYAAGKNYFMGYEFMLGNVHEHLAIMQWKKQDSTAAPLQDIPFNLQFTETSHTTLSLGYTPPGRKYTTIWTSGSPFSTNETHNIALAWDTMAGGSNKLQMWLDGTSVVEKSGLNLWTGDCHPKVGIYRGEEGDHPDGHSSVFDLWVYRVQVSDASMGEVSEASGVKA